MADRPRDARVRWLDSLRGFAACSVALFWHYSHFGGGCQPGWCDPGLAPGFRTWPISLLYGWGCYGVDFFFVLSGIVFSLVYWDRVASREGIMPLEFFRRRFARLYPMHIATLLLISPMIWEFWFFTGRFPLYNGGATNDCWDFLYNLLFIQGGVFQAYSGYNAPSWSLTVEEMMYVTFFTMAWVWGHWLPRAVPWVMGTAMTLAGWWYLVDGGQNQVVGLFINDEVARGVLGFGIGMLTYRLRHAGRWAVAGLAVAYAIINNPALGAIPRMDINFAVVLLGIWYCRPLQWLLSFRPLVALGDCSLTIYLMHLPIQTALICVWYAAGSRIPLSSWAFWGFYAGLVVAVSYWVNQVYEQPMRRWIRGESLQGAA